MYTKTLNEIVTTLGFLNDKGFGVKLWLSEEFSEQHLKELSEFLVDKNSIKSNSIYDVIYNDKTIAKLHFSCEIENVSILGIPLKYMLERLYEENKQSLTEISEHDIYHKAIHFIRENYAEGITVADVAKHIGYSESYFGYAFKKKYKMSVSRYVRELQLAKAKDLLVDTGFTISAVASYVGFDDSNYFSALFKKQFGLSPKDFRKKLSNFVVSSDT